MKWTLCSCFGFWFLILKLPVSTGQFQVIGSTQPIVALAGDDVILPCHLEPATSDFSETVEWTRPDLDPEYIHVHQSGRLVLAGQNPQYKYRTVLFVDELKNGNVSLKLFSVTISDEGTYRLFIPSMWKRAFIQLHVGSVSSPVIEITKSSSGVVLECECKGWYPEPELFWLDGEGNILSAGPPETVRGPDGLYTVSSRVTVEKTDTNSFTCRAQQLSINQTRDTQVQVPEDFFMVSSGCLAAHITIAVAVVLMCVALIVFLVYKWKKHKIDIRRWARENKMCQALCPLKTCCVETETETKRGQRNNICTGDTVQSLMEGNNTEQLNIGHSTMNNLNTKNTKLEEQQMKENELKLRMELEKLIERLQSELEMAEKEIENERELRETEKQTAKKKKEEYKGLLKKASKVLMDRRTELEMKLKRTEDKIILSNKKEKIEQLTEALKDTKTMIDEIQNKL